jgi:hypothetical protein
MNAFCASENFESFIVFRSSQPMGNDAENSSSKRSSFKGSDHTRAVILTRSRYLNLKTPSAKRRSKSFNALWPPDAADCGSYRRANLRPE